MASTYRVYDNLFQKYYDNGTDLVCDPNKEVLHVDLFVGRNWFADIYLRRHALRSLPTVNGVTLPERVLGDG